MVGTGTTALVSRFWGEGDYESANRVANRSIALAAIVGGVVCTLFFTGAPLLAEFLGMQSEQARITVRYLRVDAFGHFFYGFGMIGAAALRGAGDTRSPMVILGLVSVLNVILSPLLVYGTGPFPEMGVDGIVTGTIIARITGGLFMLAALARGLSGLQLRRRELLIRGDVAGRILQVGIPAAVDGAILWSAQVFFLRIINDINDYQPGAYAAHMIGIEIEAISYLPAVAWGYAAATVLGQSLGANDQRRAKRAGHEAALQCGLLGVALTAIFFFGAPYIYALMHRDSEVHAAGVPAFQMNALFQIPLIVHIVYLIALRGAGDTRRVMIINIFGAFGVRVPVAYLCGIVWELGLLGAWIGMVSDVLVRAILLWWRYVREGWMRVRV
jgi:putative MATE family efflux protein